MALSFAERLDRTMKGDPTLKYEERVSVKEALHTHDAAILIPETVSGIMLESAEPQYLVSPWFQKIRLDGPGKSMTFPAIGALRAHDIAEGAPYPEETLDINLFESPMEVKVSKVGLKVKVTHEMISDSQWDVIAMHLKQAGRAMARKKEEKCFYAFSKYGHTIFDNMLRTQHAEAGTTGKNEHGELNDTMNVADMIDMVIAIMANGYQPTDILLHPLTWSVFMKNDLLGAFSQAALGGYGVDWNSNLNKQHAPAIKLNPDGMAGRMPFPINITFSPFIPINQETKRFDMYCIDRNEIGVMLVKEEMTTEDFDDPSRDMLNLKVKERYGLGLLNEGRAISVAKNIALSPSYPDPVVIRTVS